MGKLKTYQEQVQEAVAKAIDAAEAQYAELAAKPFELAEKVEAEAKTYSVKALHDLHNEYATSLYSALRKLNERLNGYAADLIARIEKDVAEGAESVAEAADSVKKTVSETAKKATGKSTKKAEDTATA